MNEAVCIVYGDGNFTCNCTEEFAGMFCDEPGIYSWLSVFLLLFHAYRFSVPYVQLCFSNLLTAVVNYSVTYNVSTSIASFKC